MFKTLALAVKAGLLLAAAAQAQEASPSGDIALRLPVACEIGRTCFVQNHVDRDPAGGVRDYRCGTLTYDGHNGVDFRLPTLAAQEAGVDVLAAAAGTVLRVRDGVEDVSVKARGRESVAGAECGNGLAIGHGGGWETQYCHMARGSLAVKPGDRVAAGDRIGRIGLSGLTEYPHLHFTLRKDGRVMDPFAAGAPAASGSCADRNGKTYWEPALERLLAYRPGLVLNRGFAPGPVTMEAIESGAAGREAPGPQAPALVAFVRAIGLKAGDVQVLTLLSPDGRPLARNQAPPLDADKAQWMMFAGLRRPAEGFPKGAYRAVYRVERAGRPVIEETFGTELGP